MLAERFKHHVRFNGNDMILTNSDNTIRIEEHKKGHLDVTYNVGRSHEKTVRVSHKQVYDLIIKILIRYECHEVTLNQSAPIQIEDWIEEEQRNRITIIELKRTIKKENSEHVILGGNRLEAEYYKGIIILIDDIMMQPFNVVDFDLEG